LVCKDRKLVPIENESNDHTHEEVFFMFFQGFYYINPWFF
jgi:hypothetical protein